MERRETQRNDVVAGQRSGHRRPCRLPQPLPLYAEYKEPLYAAPPILQRMVDAGRLGRKAGAGFYQY